MAENLKNKCVLIPLTSTGVQSILYKKLLERLKDRPLVNYLYAMSLHPGVIQHMQASGYTLLNGELRAEDFIKEFKIDNIAMARKSTLIQAQVDSGSVDARSHDIIKYSNAKEAIDKANAFNAANSVFIAQVIRTGKEFIIKVKERDATTQLIKDQQIEYSKLWATLDSIFAAQGVSLQQLHEEIPYAINPMLSYQIPSRLKRIKDSARLDMLTVDDIHLLLKMDENSTQVQRLLSFGWGDLSAISDKIYDALKRPSMVTSGQMALIEATLNRLKEFNGFDLDAIDTQIANETASFRATSEGFQIKDILLQLQKDYVGIADDIVQLGNKITSLREAAGAALLSLQKERNELERKQGVTSESIDIDKIEDSLAQAIQDKKYYIGLLDYLVKAEDSISTIDSILGNVPTSDDVLQRNKDMASAIKQASNILDTYKDVIQALSSSNADNILVDEHLTEEEKDELRQRAKELNNILSSKQEYLKDLQAQVFTEVAYQILGTQGGIEQAAIDTLIAEKIQDSSYLDYLYSVGRQSNALIGMMGQVIQDAQSKRNSILNSIIHRIDAATEQLQKATKSLDTSFMYDELDDNRFLNPYNWNLYYKAMQGYRQKLVDRDVTGAALQEQMQQWVENNTTQEVVDSDSGRTERMPRLDKYPKFRFKAGNAGALREYYQRITGKKGRPSNTWISEHINDLVANDIIVTYNPVAFLDSNQLIYYNKIMKLKGELGTMLPAYAQQHYLAPQVTRNLQDNLASGNIRQGLKQWAKDTFTITDKDQELNRDYFEIGDEKSAVVRTEKDGRIPRRIPIYYATALKKEDKQNLLKEASGAMAHLAGTAVNYQCMSEVEDLVNTLGDYITQSIPVAKTSTGEKKVDGVQSSKVTVLQWAKDHLKSSSTTQAIVEGMIDQHLYDITLNPKDAQHKKLAKITQLGLAYSSTRNLTLNLKGMVSNLLVGEAQMMIDAVSGSLVKLTGTKTEFYAVKDYIWAHDILFKRMTKDGKSKNTTLIDLLSNNTESYNGLLGELFDPVQDNFSEKSRKKYHTKIGNLIDKDWMFIGYGSGEHLIHYVNMLSILHNRKVLYNGKKISLYYAFEIQTDSEGVKSLQVKSGVTQLDGSAVTQEYLDSIRGLIKEANQNMHGSMNKEDQGIVKQRLIGRCAMHLRTWMIEYYSRRYRGSHYSTATQSEREGFYYTVFKSLHDMIVYHRGARANWHLLNEHQKQNVMRTCTELTSVLVGSIIGWCGFLDPDDYSTWLERFWLYQIKRLIQDIKAAAPLGAITEAESILGNLFPLLSTIRRTLYPLVGLANGDIFKEVTRGDHKGENRYMRNIKKYFIPYWDQIEQMLDLEDEDDIFKVFDGTFRG